MFIQTEETKNPATLKFLPGCTVLGSGTAEFGDADAARRSPLAAELFEAGSVTAVSLGADYIAVTKAEDAEWHRLKPAILGAIMQHFVAGNPVISDGGAAEAVEQDDAAPEVIAQITELIDTRILPAVAQSGGDVKFHSFQDGVVYLQMQGSASAMIDNITNVLSHYLPEVVAVRDHRDALPKPGLKTPQATTIQQLLDERINPAVAAHGGHISLVDVQEDTAYIRLEGGCQGCGMADVTLKQGIETEIKHAVPQIRAVLDVTDHAGGSNPYYEPGKTGTSPL